MEPIGEITLPGDSGKPIAQQVGKLKVYGNPKGHKITPVTANVNVNAAEDLKIKNIAQQVISKRLTR